MTERIGGCNYMKRYGHLYEKIYDMENLKLAHQHAKKGKGWYAEVQMIDSDPDKYLKELQDMLINKTCKDMKKKMVKIRKKVESGNMMNYSEWCSINSYKGWTDYGNCFRLTQKYVEPLIPYATKYYELNVKKGGKVA